MAVRAGRSASGRTRPARAGHVTNLAPPQELTDGDAAFLRNRTRPNYASGTRTLRVADLFAGCGGMTLGVMEACRTLGLGCEVALALELDDDVRAVYEANFEPRVAFTTGNVRGVFHRRVGRVLSEREREARDRVGTVDVLVGGPPCQGHSTLNNHTRAKDPKNALYMRVVRAAEVLTPELVIIENVPAIVNDATRVLDRATTELKALGYRVDSGTVSVAQIGVPQLRTRHVLLAARGAPPSIDDAVAAHRIPAVRNVRWALAGIDARARGTFDTASRLSEENLARARHLRASREYNLDNDRRPPCHQDPSHRYKSMYGRLRWTEPAQTITTGFGSPGQGRYLHPSKLRTLTPHEAARIQFFPDWFDFSAATTRGTLARCIGNAVPPKLAFVAARHLLGLRAVEAREEETAIDTAAE